MASHIVPLSLRDSRPSSQPRLSVHAPSARTATIVVIAIVILFRWLHLILALQITSTGRQIQLKTEELRQRERAIAVLQEQIAIAQSPQNLAVRASLLGYAPCTPVYIMLDEPLASPDPAGITKAGTYTATRLEADPSRAFDTWLKQAQGP